MKRSRAGSSPARPQPHQRLAPLSSTASAAPTPPDDATEVSSAAEGRRGASPRITAPNDDDDEEGEEVREGEEAATERTAEEEKGGEQVTARRDDAHAEDGGEEASGSMQSASGAAPLSSSSLSSFTSALSASGLLYFSRLPPHLKPEKLRQLLSCYGVIGRIFLTPEQSHLTRSRSTRRAQSASTARRYIDGWVEFLDKRMAKQVALTLNGTTVGGRKRGYWYDDVWSVRYLKGFKWNHLTERVAYEGKLKEGRRREEVGRAKKESDRYVQQVEQSKRIQQIQQRKGSKRKREGQEEVAERTGSAEEQQRPRVLRTFYQRPVVNSRALE